MQIKYIDIHEVLKEKNIIIPEFSIFNNDGKIIQIAYWQPEGRIDFSLDFGFKNITEEHCNKAKAFLNYAKKVKAGIAITPEYSMPWTLLKEIFQDESLFPSKGKLWCLGMEGISYDELKKFVNSSHNAHIIIENLDDLDESFFCSCIVYLFSAKQEHVCVVQLKTTPASDAWGELESQGLTLGKSIYYFHDSNSQNALISYICADALRQEITYKRKELKCKNYIILHPQLNPKPLHDSFNQMRRNFLDYSNERVRIISVNWSKGSYLYRDEFSKKIEVRDSFTACYYNVKTHIEEKTKLLNYNRSKGISLSQDNYISVWHMPSNEHCMLLRIACFGAEGLHSVASMQYEPLANTCLKFDTEQNIWKEQEGCNICNIDWEWLKNEFQLEKCSDGKCNVSKLHKFFSILFAKDLYSDLQLKEGQSQVLFEKLSEDSERQRKERDRVQFINEALKTNNIPTKFSCLKDKKYQWILDDTGNIKSEKENETFSVVYVDACSEELIKKAIVRFENLMGKTATDKMLLYHLSAQGIKYYDGIYNTKINNPNLTQSVNSIK